MLSNSPGNVGLEASPFKFPLEYLEVLGGLESEAYQDFKRLFREGFEAARKHCDSIVGKCPSFRITMTRSQVFRVALVELMQKGSCIQPRAATRDVRVLMSCSCVNQILSYHALLLSGNRRHKCYGIGSSRTYPIPLSGIMLTV